MRRLTYWFMFLLIATTPLLALAQGTGEGTGAELVIPLIEGEPATSEAALALGEEVINHFANGEWYLGVAGVAFLFMFFARRFGLWKRVGKKWAYRVLILLGLLAFFMTKFALGVGWMEALMAALVTPALPWLAEAFDHGFRAKEHETDVG